MTTEQLPAFDAQTLTFQVYSEQAQATNQLQQPPMSLDDAAARHYLSIGITEERSEIDGRSDDPAYSRAEVLWAPFYYAARYREQLRAAFPEQVTLQAKEFGDLLWYMSERLRTEPDQRLSLHQAANAGVQALDPQTAPITTFAAIDHHSKNHPLLLRMPHPLHDQSLPGNVDDLFEHPVATWPGAVFPAEIEPVYASNLLFNRQLNNVVEAIDQLDRDEGSPELHQQLLTDCGKVLWISSFILRERLGSSLAQVAVDSIVKTAGRLAKGNIFGSGDRR